jgi:hypothetical protein
VDSKLGLRFISKMNQQPEYLLANSVESVKQTKQIGVSRLSEYFLLAFYFQFISKRFQLCFAISGKLVKWLLF